MVKFSKVFFLLGGICLVSPVMACDEVSDDEDAVSAPVAYQSGVSPAQRSQRSLSFEEILNFSKELPGMDDGEYDDGDYASAPEDSYVKAPAKQAKATSKPKVKVAKKKVDKKAKNYALKASFNNRPTTDPFE